MSLWNLSLIHWLLRVLSKASVPETDQVPSSATLNITRVSRPAFDELPLRKGDPKGSAWHFWGRDDELGSLNLITEDVSRAAAREVVLGKSINLNLPLDVPLKPMNPRRKPCMHTFIAKGHANDDEIAQEQNVTFRRGDVLIIRTGWTATYSKLSTEEKERLGGRDDRASIGVEATEDAFRWHWEQQFAAVASDTVAYGAWPSPNPWGVCMHEVLLSGWGTPIGKCWDLEKLSETCKQLKRWTFLLTSQPLNLPGGVASPPNATAMF